MAGEEAPTFHWSGWQRRHGAYLIIQTYSEGEIWWWTDSANWSVEDNKNGGILMLAAEKVPEVVKAFFEANRSLVRTIKSE